MKTKKPRRQLTTELLIDGKKFSSRQIDLGATREVIRRMHSEIYVNPFLRLENLRLGSAPPNIADKSKNLTIIDAETSMGKTDLPVFPRDLRDRRNRALREISADCRARDLRGIVYRFVCQQLDMRGICGVGSWSHLTWEAALASRQYYGAVKASIRAIFKA